LPAIWSYLSDRQFYVEARKIDSQVAIPNATIEKVPFDLEHWQKVAAEKYPNGLPKPFSGDPAQWLFNGYPHKSDNPTPGGGSSTALLSVATADRDRVSLIVRRLGPMALKAMLMTMESLP